MGFKSDTFAVTNKATVWLLGDSKSLEYTNAGRIHKSRAALRIAASVALIAAAVVLIYFGFLQNDSVKDWKYVKREDDINQLKRAKLLAGLEQGTYHCPCGRSDIPYSSLIATKAWDNNLDDFLANRQYWLCNRRTGLINITDTYCMQLFEDLGNTLRDSSFVSVELQALSGLANILQRDIERASYAAKVSAVTTTLLYLQLSGDSDPDNALGFQVRELNNNFFPAQVLPFIASITADNINASSPNFATGAASPNITVDWDESALPRSTNQCNYNFHLFWQHYYIVHMFAPNAAVRPDVD